MKEQNVFKELAICVIAFLMVSQLSAQDASLEDTYRASSVRVDNVGKILIITDQNYNDTELFYPYYRLIEAGYEVTIASIEGGEIAGYNSAPVKQTVSILEVDETTYLGLYLPGGHAPEKLREDNVVLEKVHHFISSGKPVAAICHGPQILARLGVLEGKRVTAWPGIENEMAEAGAQFINQPVVQDGMIITARMPGDLPPHLHGFLKMLKD